MMVPDTNMIAEVSLFVNGFTTASILAVKLSRFYEMIKSQISLQVLPSFFPLPYPFPPNTPLSQLLHFVQTD